LPIEYINASVGVRSTVTNHVYNIKIFSIQCVYVHHEPKGSCTAHYTALRFVPFTVVRFVIII